MNPMRETAFAKINLALHVRRRRSDGYHDLESLFAFARDGDDLVLESEGKWGLTIEGPFAQGLSTGPDNLVLRTGAAMARAFGKESGAQFRLTKNLPVASGIGGGSADAAAGLRLLARLWAIDIADPRMMEVAAGLGADVPACLLSHPVRGEGVGDALQPLADTLTRMPLLLANPGIPLGTGEVFARWDGEDRGALAEGEPMAAALDGRNDLTDPAIALVPEIGDLLALLETLTGVTLARMSGSGATCFALFESDAARDIGAAMVRLAMPSAWVMPTALR